MVQSLAHDGHEMATETISWVAEFYDEPELVVDSRCSRRRRGKSTSRATSSSSSGLKQHFADDKMFRLQKGLEDKGYEEWVGEMIGMREILKHFSNITTSEVVGMRAPYLKPGRNTQYKVLEDFGYIYDSSIGISPLKVPIWPYTLDYKIPHECKAGTCPTKSFQGNDIDEMRESGSLCNSVEDFDKNKFGKNRFRHFCQKE